MSAASAPLVKRAVRVCVCVFSVTAYGSGVRKSASAQLRYTCCFGNTLKVDDSR